MEFLDAAGNRSRSKCHQSHRVSVDNKTIICVSKSDQFMHGYTRKKSDKTMMCYKYGLAFYGQMPFLDSRNINCVSITIRSHFPTVSAIAIIHTVLCWHRQREMSPSSEVYIKNFQTAEILMRSQRSVISTHFFCL